MLVRPSKTLRFTAMTPVHFSPGKQYLIGFSILNIIVGLTSIGLEVWTLVSLADSQLTEYTWVQGIWCGVCYLLTGILGFVVSRKSTKRMFIIELISSLLSICVAAAGTTVTWLQTCFDTNCDETIRNVRVSLLACSLLGAIVNIATAVIISMGIHSFKKSENELPFQRLATVSLEKLPRIQPIYLIGLKDQSTD